LSILGKACRLVIQQRMKKYVEESIAKKQVGFLTGRGTVDQIFVMRQLVETFYKKHHAL